MDANEMKEFMATQVHWLEVAKWYEGERLGHEPGEDFALQWVKEHGQEFRTWWESSHNKGVNNA